MYGRARGGLAEAARPRREKSDYFNEDAEEPWDMEGMASDIGIDQGKERT